MRTVAAVLTALLIAILITIGLLSARSKLFASDPVEELAAAMRGQRSIEPRLSGGFEWVALPRAMLGRSDGDELQAKATVADILRRSQSDVSPRGRHGAALAHLLTGDAREAAAILETIATSDALVWSDLAAARYVNSIRQNEPSVIASALVAVDTALRLDPSLVEARFNRALILEALGLRDQALDAWNAYVPLDPASDWANEAHQHITRLRVVEAEFKDEYDRSYDRLAADPAAARSLVRRYPQDSRLWGETMILDRWAAAEKSGDAAAAEHLQFARELGAELARFNGDHMLHALVAAIDRADATARRTLAEGHQAFREGQKAYRSGRLADAERILEIAAAKFERGRSPGAMLARYFVANLAYDQGRIDEAHRRLTELVRTAPQQFPAHRAQLLWELGIVHLAQARWGPCIETLTESIETFDRLGEKRYAATVREILVEAYDRVGNPSMAWKHRMLTLRELGQRVSSRLQLTLTSVTRAAVMNHNWPMAISFIDLEIDIARRIDNQVLHAETLILRARVHSRMNDNAATAADLAAIKAMVAGLNDAGFRSLLGADVKAIEAVVTTDREAAVGLLTEAIEFHSTSGRRMHLPEMLLDRGRIFRASHDEARAAADFETGIAELEKHRESLPQGEERWGIFHSADDLFAEAIDLSLKRGDPKKAFEYAERARARALLDALGSARSSQTADIPDTTAVVEFATHANGIVIFLVDRSGVRAVSHPVKRATLVEATNELTRAAAESDRPRMLAAGRLLYRHLIQPIEHGLAGKTTIALVPDNALAGAPFAALTDESGHFLIERYVLKVEPSAAVFGRLKRHAYSTNKHALIVSGAEELGPLTAARDEANEIAAIYKNTTRLDRAAATRQRFLREAPSAEIIHFSGHAVATADNGRNGYLLLAAGSSADGYLDIREIAALKLLRTSLVVLAACGTAAGEVRATEGTISVARAFVAAGVPTVIGTLWPIEDRAAAAFFPEFHRKVARGMPPAEALQATQLEWIHRSGAESSLWASVQVVGE